MQKSLKILLSAYACEPGKGSEPGVGWNWAINLAKQGHHVVVITRKNNQKRIEGELSKIHFSGTLEFAYFDLSQFYLYLKKILGVRFYYEIWQYAIVNFAKKLDQRHDFDVVHHITFGVVRHPSHLYRLEKFFIFGPIGGGEYASKELLKGFSCSIKISEQIRYLSNKYSFRRKSLKKCLDSSNIILCKTNDTSQLIPEKYLSKVKVQTEIGVDTPANVIEKILDNSFTVLYVGQLVHWKGAHLAIKAFSCFLKKNPKADLRLVGTGKYEGRLKALARSLGISDKVKFIGWVPQVQLRNYYENAKVFLYPSLHDSSGNVVLEAMSYNLPTVCLNLGGPSFLLGECSPTIVDCQGKTELEVVESISELLTRLFEDEQFYETVTRWTSGRVAQMSWSAAVSNCYSSISSVS